MGLLGQGGMGRVYEVSHPDLPGRRLALKLALAGGVRDELVERFQREAELLARLRHPNVVAVHASGIAPEGPWIAMELVEGRSLSRLLEEQGPFPPRQAAELALALAEAVAAVHAAGVLHRDLKPGNVIVRPDGSPVLIDFGLARADDLARLTRSGTLLGSPLFMAPEQLDGTSPDALDARVDVWGLGTILCALLAGRGPIEPGPLPEVMARVLHGEPRWPSADTPGVPPELEAVLRRALARRPADRHPTAAALAEELRRFLRGEPGARRRGPGPMIALALAALGTALGLALTRQAARPAPSAGSADQGGVVSASPAPPAAPSPAGLPPRPTLLAHPDEPRAAGARFLAPGRAVTWNAKGPPGSPRPAGTLLCVWTLEERRPRILRRWPLAGALSVLAVDPAGVAVLVSGGPGNQDVYEVGPDWLAEPRHVAHLETRAELTALALSPEGARLALGGWAAVAGKRSSYVAIYSRRTGAAEVSFGVDMELRALAYLDEARLAVGGGGGAFDVTNGIMVSQVDPAPARQLARVSTTNMVTSLALDRERRLHAGNTDWRIHPIDLEEQALGPPWEGRGTRAQLGAEGRPSSHLGDVTRIAFADRAWAYTLSSGSRPVENEVRAWRRAEDGAWTNPGGLLEWTSGVSDLDLSPDGAWLLIGTRGGAELWPVEEVHTALRPRREARLE